KMNLTEKILVPVVAVDNAAMIIRVGITVLVSALAFLGPKDYVRFASVVLIGVMLSLAILFSLAYFISRRLRDGNGSDREMKITSPLNMKLALVGVSLYVFILIVVKLVAMFFGSYAIFITSFMGGLVNALATVLSLLSLGNTVDMRIISTGSLLSISAAIANKIIYALVSSRKKEDVEIVILCSIPPAVVLGIYSILVYLYG
ncbi:MAG: DUF4010 domain-containing protein, partial [Fervidicoccaceae archaeon]